MADRYGSMAGVKERLGISKHDFDTELENGLQWGTTKVRVRLLSKGVTPPSYGSEGKLLESVVDDFAAYYYQRNRDPKKATLYKNDAVEGLADYVEGENIGIFKRSSQA